MSSTNDPTRGAESETGRSTLDDGAQSETICIVCQRPLDPDDPDQWRGEPVHLECGASLRCGITLDHDHSG